MKTIDQKDRRIGHRIETTADGHFLTQDNRISGILKMLDYSQNGIRARLSQQITPGSRVALKVNLQDNNLPLFPTGRIIWTEEAPSLGHYLVGIHLDDYDAIGEKSTEEKFQNNHYFEKAADYAFCCGKLSRKTTANFKNNISFLPAAFILYFFFGGLITYRNIIFTFAYALSIFLITGCVLWKNRSAIIVKSYRKHDNSQTFKQIANNAASILLIQLCYGLFFVGGYIAAGIESLRQKIAQAQS